MILAELSLIGAVALGAVVVLGLLAVVLGEL